MIVFTIQLEWFLSTLQFNESKGMADVTVTIHDRTRIHVP